MNVLNGFIRARCRSRKSLHLKILLGTQYQWQSSITEGIRDRHAAKGLQKKITFLPRSQRGSILHIDPRNFESTKVSTSIEEFSGTPGTVATITINNFEKMNKLDSSTLDQLTGAFRSLSTTKNLRVVILTGATPPPDSRKRPAFCGGADVNEMAALSDSAGAEAFIRKIHNVCQAIRHCPVVVIARIHGICLGAGMEIAAACDFRYATNISTFAMPEVSLGIPSVVEARLLVNLMGWSMTRTMVYHGTQFSAKAMYDKEFLSETYFTTRDLDISIRKSAQRMALNGPKAMRSQKKLLRKWEEESVYHASIEAGVKAFSQMWDDGGQEPKEYMGKFWKPEMSSRLRVEDKILRSKNAAVEPQSAPWSEPESTSSTEPHTPADNDTDEQQDQVSEIEEADDSLYDWAREDTEPEQQYPGQRGKD